MRRFIVDTDTASDDAVALVMALRHPDVRVEAITVVSGNAPLEQCVQNALYTAEICGASDVPVYAGRPGPLLRAKRYATHVHGEDGMGDIGLPLGGRTAAAGHAVDQLVERIGQAPGEITLVTLGPLSNIALALLRAPELAQQVRHCVIMGGTSDSYGNISPVAEANIWNDPEAARIVFDSGMPITMVGWDIARKYAVLEPADMARLRAIGTPLAHFCVDIQATLQQFVQHVTKLPGVDMADPVAMAVALDPAIATKTLRVPVAIDTTDGPGRGQTILDHRSILGRAHAAEVVTEADWGRFVGLLERSVSI